MWVKLRWKSFLFSAVILFFLCNLKIILSKLPWLQSAIFNITRNFVILEPFSHQSLIIKFSKTSYVQMFNRSKVSIFSKSLSNWLKNNWHDPSPESGAGRKDSDASGAPVGAPVVSVGWLWDFCFLSLLCIFVDPLGDFSCRVVYNDW